VVFKVQIVQYLIQSLYQNIIDAELVSQEIISAKF